MPGGGEEVNKTIWTLGYGILKGTHEERKVKFQKRLQWIKRGVGKPTIALVDIRRAGCGSMNGIWFHQSVTERRHKYPHSGMSALVGELDCDVTYSREPELANEWGVTQAGLKRYAHQLERAIIGFTDTEQLKSLQRIVDIALEGERAVVLLCGCKQAFKKNGTSWNCHRVPLGSALVGLLGPEWAIIHL